jgi:hypothetical protein
MRATASESMEVLLERLAVEMNAIGGGNNVRVTFPNGETETVYGFVTLADAKNWIRASRLSCPLQQLALRKFRFFCARSNSRLRASLLMRDDAHG